MLRAAKNAAPDSLKENMNLGIFKRKEMCYTPKLENTNNY